MRYLLAALMVLSLLVPVFGSGVQEAYSGETEFWYPYGEGSWTGDFIAEKIGAYNEAHPNVTIIGQSYPDYASIIEAIQRAAAAKTLPGAACIAYGYDDYIAGSGLVHPLSDLIEDPEGTFFDDFFPTLLQATTFDGKVYGVPLALSVAEVFYHADLFEQAGLDPDDPPETWREFLDAARTINRELGIYGAAFALDDPWTFEVAVRSSGGELMRGDEPVLDSRVPVSVLEDWAEGAREGYFLYNADFFETLQSFGGQQVAMFAVSSYGTLYYRENLPQVRAMPWPAAEGHDVESPAGGNSLYVFGNSDLERRTAARFIRHLTTPEANAEWAMNSGYLPTRRSSLEAMGDFIRGFDNYQTAVDGIRHVVPPTDYPGRRDPQIKAAILKAIERAMLGDSSARAALRDANAEVARLINDG